MSFFERWLTLWVFLCIVAGTMVGVAAPELAQTVGGLEIAQVNLKGARVDLVRGDLVVHRDLKDAKAHPGLRERVLDEDVLPLVVTVQHDGAGHCGRRYQGG